MQIVETTFNGYIYKANTETFGLCITSTDNEVNVNFLDKFLHIIKTLSGFFKNKYNLYNVQYFNKVGKFNRVEKYYGIWRYLKQSGISFKDSSDEITIESDNRSAMIAYSKVDCDEVNNLFNSSNNIAVFANDNTMRQVFCPGNKSLIYPEYIKEALLNKDSLLVEYLELGSEGSSLFLYAKKDNMVLNWEGIKNIIEGVL